MTRMSFFLTYLPKRNSFSCILAFVVVIYLASLAPVYGSCANACWGHGICNSDDVCECFAGWMSNDCGERICPSGVSFVTTPQTDGNFDGDLYDSSLRQFVDQEYKESTSNRHFGPTASIPSLGDVLTVDEIHRSKLATVVGEASMLNVNDNIVFFKHNKAYTFVIVEILKKDEQYRVTPPMDVDGIESLPFYPFYPNQRFPHGDWEMWPAFYSPKNEAHFYMECSNNGYCDRLSGTCKCFHGYTGYACEKQRCEKYCHEHGECKSIAEMANDTPKLLNVTGVSTTKGSKIVLFDDSFSIPSTLSSNGGDSIIIGSVSKAFTVAFHDGNRKLTLLEDFPKTYPRSTPVWQKMVYKLWDANLFRGCACDPGYEGWDCSERKCPRGHDPAITYYGGYDPFTHDGSTRHSPYKYRNERQVLHVQSTTAYPSGNFTLRYTDTDRGIAYNTTNIPTIVKLHVKAYVNGPFLYFERTIMNYELSVGDYVEISHEYRRIEKLQESGTRSDQYHAAIMGSPIQTLNTINLMSNGSTVDIGADPYLISISAPYITYGTVSPGDFIILDSHVRRVAKVTLSENAMITAISIRYENNITSVYPKMLGGVDYWSPFPDNILAQSLYGYRQATAYSIMKITIAQKIKEAMLKLPMMPLKYLKVSVKKSGHMLSKCVVESPAPNRNTLSFKSCLLNTSSTLSEYTTLLVGDLIRVGDEVRRVQAVTASSIVINSPLSVPGKQLTSTPVQLYHLNGWRYEIDFGKGKNDFDEQGTAGNIPTILCDDTKLKSSILLSVTGAVKIDSPNILVLSANLPLHEQLSVGNFVRVGNQTREILTVLSDTEFECKTKFLRNIQSTATNIFDTGTYVRRIYNEEDNVQCFTTDFHRIMLTGTNETQEATVDSSNGEMNIVTHSQLVDPSEILVDDRIAIMDILHNTWEIRTVYKILSTTSFQVQSWHLDVVMAKAPWLHVLQLGFPGKSW